jgi:signal peptidase II
VRLTLAICGLVVLADQATKALADSQIERGGQVEVLPFLNFENSRNRGIAFGLAGDAAPLLIAATMVIVIALLAFIALRARGRGVALAAGLIVGGALGNLVDRARQGAVTDFIELPAWPTFNLADMAIVAGVFVLLFAYERADPDRAGSATAGEH